MLILSEGFACGILFVTIHNTTEIHHQLEEQTEHLEHKKD